MDQPEYKIADTSVNTIRFYNSHAADNIEVLRLSKDGIWANPDIPADDAAKLVLAAIDSNIKLMVQQAVKDHDRARELLERCETEMRYAGWDKFEADNTARNGVYEQVKHFLDPMPLFDDWPGGFKS